MILRELHSLASVTDTVKAAHCTPWSAVHCTAINPTGIDAAGLVPPAPAVTGCSAEWAHNLAGVRQGSRTLQQATCVQTASHYLSAAGRAAWVPYSVCITWFCPQLFLSRMHLCNILGSRNIYQAFCCLVLWPSQKLPVISQCHCQISAWLFSVSVKAVLMCAEKALLACADRLAFQISTVILFHRLPADGTFHLTCEFPCSEIGRRSRWLWKKRKTERAGNHPPAVLLGWCPSWREEGSHAVWCIWDWVNHWEHPGNLPM